MSFVIKGRGKEFVEAVLRQDAAALAAQEAEIARRVRGELARLRAEAEAEGRASGEAAARRNMLPELEGLRQAAAALRAAQAELAAPLAEKEQELAQLVTELSFLVARHIIGVEAAANPAALQSLIAKLIAEAAAERGPQQSLVLRVNPADEVRLAPVVGPGIDLLADEKISRGGALLELVAPGGDPLDRTEWDATVEGRMETLRGTLDLDSELT